MKEQKEKKERKERILKLPPVGMRIIKSAIGVWLCYVVYILRGKQGIVFYSQLAILWCMQPYISNSLKMAAQRTTGTLIGAAYGLLVILLRLWWLPQVFAQDICYYLLVSLMVIPVLYTTVLLHRKNASYFSTVVFLSIVVAHMGDENPVLFTINRVLDTMIGIGLGVLVNMFRIPRKKREDILFVSGVDDTLLNEKESLSPYSKIELNRMLQEGAKFTVSTMRTPASVIDVLGEIQWTLPLIVMDGAALYDMKERRYLATVKLDTARVKELLHFFDEQGMNCFVNVVVDGLLVISYQELKNEAEQKLYQELRKSPYRNFVKANLMNQGEVLYLMTIGKTEEMEQIFGRLHEMKCFPELKVCFYASTNYPGYSYLKIYDKEATREKMMEVLKEQTGLERTMTFGSLEGRYDVVVHRSDSNKVVKILERMYEPYFWEKA
ncbi:MAG: HAD hydrolase family protein [Candidatus Limivivens sp.]|nr:HAD hydrolase family protein [Candidatus Limivivens sp.]